MIIETFWDVSSAAITLVRGGNFSKCAWWCKTDICLAGEVEGKTKVRYQYELGDKRNETPNRFSRVGFRNQEFGIFQVDATAGPQVSLSRKIPTFLRR